MAFNQNKIGVFHNWDGKLPTLIKKENDVKPDANLFLNELPYMYLYSKKPSNNGINASLKFWDLFQKATMTVHFTLLPKLCCLIWGPNC